jgi:hypothetical protein
MGGPYRETNRSSIIVHWDYYFYRIDDISSDSIRLKEKRTISGLKTEAKLL